MKEKNQVVQFGILGLILNGVLPHHLVTVPLQLIPISKFTLLEIVLESEEASTLKFTELFKETLA